VGFSISHTEFDCDEHGIAIGFGHGDAYAYDYGHRNHYAYGHRNAYAYGHGDAYSHSDGNAVSFRKSERHMYTNPFANSDSSRHTNPLRLAIHLSQSNANTVWNVHNDHNTHSHLSAPTAA
jgi:hypothetical protein